MFQVRDFITTHNKEIIFVLVVVLYTMDVYTFEYVVVYTVMRISFMCVMTVLFSFVCICLTLDHMIRIHQFLSFIVYIACWFPFFIFDLPKKKNLNALSYDFFVLARTTVVPMSMISRIFKYSFFFVLFSKMFVMTGFGILTD